jgi:hypothetical protein
MVRGYYLALNKALFQPSDRFYARLFTSAYGLSLSRISMHETAFRINEAIPTWMDDL